MENQFTRGEKSFEKAFNIGYDKSIFILYPDDYHGSPTAKLNTEKPYSESEIKKFYFNADYNAIYWKDEDEETENMTDEELYERFGRSPFYSYVFVFYNRREVENDPEKIIEDLMDNISYEVMEEISLINNTKEYINIIFKQYIKDNILLGISHDQKYGSFLFHNKNFYYNSNIQGTIKDDQKIKNLLLNEKFVAESLNSFIKKDF